MFRKNKRSSRSGRIAVMVAAGIAAVSFAGTASPFSAGTSGSSSGETCLFSTQLQKSVEVRRQYLVALSAVTGEDGAPTAVESMYGNVKPASYEADAEEETGFLGLSIKKAQSRPVGIDSFSADCLGCHDGVSAQAVSLDLRNSPMNRRSRVGGSSTEHPMGMNYAMYQAVDRGFKPLPPNTKMVFVEGKMGCLTCHDPLNQERGHLVMSDRNSALCYTCHDK